MSDLFLDIMDKNSKTKSADVATKTPASQPSLKPSSSAECEGSKNSEKSSSKKLPAKDIKDSKSKSTKPETSSVDKLAEIMTAGFSDLKEFLSKKEESVYDYDDDYYDYENDYDEDAAEYSVLDSPVVELDLFDCLANDVNGSKAVGAEVRPSLAKLADKFLNLNLEDSFLKEVRENHLRPGNVEFLGTPKINKPIWENLSTSTRIKESSFQAIQSDFLNSAVPVLKVMEQIFDAKEDLNTLDAKGLLDSLKDSLIFLGSANKGMIKARRDNVKRDLPKPMQGLCRDSVAFSSTNLFGDSLNSSIKEVSELNRISNNLRPRGSMAMRSRGRGFSNRGRGRGFRRGGRGRGSAQRFQPYNKERKAPNQSGPSNN